MNKISRRRFLALAGGAAGASVLGCAGLAWAGTRQLPVELDRHACEGETAQKVLVAYATRCGSTGGVAKAVGQALCAAGAAVEVLPVGEVTDVSAYSAVVLGSAVRIAKWLPEAVRFVEENEQALSRVPVVGFTVCMTTVEDTDANRNEAQAFAQVARDRIGFASEAIFAGAVLKDTLPFLLRQMLKMMDTPEGDYRDWEAIAAWAMDLYPVLGQ